MNNNSLSTKKRKRKSVNLGIKLEVLKRFESGQRAADIETPLAAVQLNRSRSAIMIQMERHLALWIRNQTENQMPCSIAIIQEKAKSLYEELKKDYSDSSDTVQPVFVASRGWFKRFKLRANLRTISENVVDVVLTDASTDESPSCGVGLYDKIAQAHCDIFAAIIRESGYTPRQVFNVQEMGLLWKRMPIPGSCMSRSGLKQSNDRLTLLLGGNAAGDLKLKPLLVYHLETPRALQGYPKSLLPVIWKSNKKSTLTQSTFVDWFTAYFCPTVKDYCLANNLPNKALLVLDTTAGHPTNLADLSENIKVVYLPSNAAALVQPMVQGVTVAFKTNYLRKVFYQVMRTTEASSSCDGNSLDLFLKEYNILNAIDNITLAWLDVTSHVMNSVWRNLWPDCVQEFQDVEESVEDIEEVIVDMARQIGIANLTTRDVEVVLASQDQLSSEDLEGTDGEEGGDEEEEEEEEQPPKTLSVQYLGEAMQHLEVAMAIFDKHDPDRQRSTTINRGIDNLVNCYRELYKEKKKVTTMQLSLFDNFVSSTPK